jgi:hypothetical protein
MKSKEYIIIESTLKRLIAEQDTPETTDETKESDDVSVFSDEEKRFLGVFANAGAKHLGIIYSLSDIGIQEFIARSGKTYNCNPAILLSLLRNNFIKIVPYGGWGRDNNYTIELQLSLDDIKAYAELAKQTQSDSSGATSPPAEDMGSTPPPPPPAEPEAPAPGPENAGVVRYGFILKESARIAKNLLIENKSDKSPKKKKSSTSSDIYSKQGRILNRLPKEFVTQLSRIVKILQRKTYNKTDQQKLIADILDNLQINFNLTDEQIRRSFEIHKKQRRLQKFLDSE